MAVEGRESERESPKEGRIRVVGGRVPSLLTTTPSTMMMMMMPAAFLKLLPPRPATAYPWPSLSLVYRLLFPLVRSVYAKIVEKAGARTSLLTSALARWSTRGRESGWLSAFAVPPPSPPLKDEISVAPRHAHFAGCHPCCLFQSEMYLLSGFLSSSLES